MRSPVCGFALIIIVGAGIAGLSLGHALAKRGAEITICEANTLASGASGIATSYLEPRLGKTAMRAAEWEGLRLWEDYALELTEASGLDVEFRKEGQLRVALPENTEKFKRDLENRQNQGWDFESLSPEETRKLEPSLSEEIRDAAFLPNVRWVTGRKVCEALAISIKRLGGQILENCPVVSIANSANNVIAVTADGQKLEGEEVVLCHTMHENMIAGLPDDIPTSRPVRGVNLLVDQSGLSQPIRHLVKHHRGNLCPRSPAELIVGTTYEPGETALEPGPDVIEKLYTNAEPILPKLRELPLIRITAGLRTKIGDGTLKLGRSRIQPRLYFSLSHAGAGYLRAPIVSSELAEFILQGTKGHFTGFVTSG